MSSEKQDPTIPGSKVNVNKTEGFRGFFSLSHIYFMMINNTPAAQTVGNKKLKNTFRTAASMETRLGPTCDFCGFIVNAWKGESFA